MFTRGWNAYDNIPTEIGEMIKKVKNKELIIKLCNIIILQGHKKLPLQLFSAYEQKERGKKQCWTKYIVWMKRAKDTVPPVDMMKEATVNEKKKYIIEWSACNSESAAEQTTGVIKLNESC